MGKVKRLWEQIREGQQLEDDPSMDPTLEEQIQMLVIQQEGLSINKLTADITRLVAENLQEALESKSPYIREKAEQLKKKK